MERRIKISKNYSYYIVIVKKQTLKPDFVVNSCIDNSYWLLSKTKDNKSVLLSIVASMTRIALLFIKPLGVAWTAYLAYVSKIDTDASCF